MDRPLARGEPADPGLLYDKAPCGLLVTAVDGVILRVNETFCSWVGREAEELLGRVKVQELFSMGGRIFHQTHLTPLLQIQGSVSEVKLEVLHRDGRRMPMVWNTVRRARQGHTFHELAVFMAEDRHKYEQELLLARRNAEALLLNEQVAQQALLEAQAERDRQRALAEDRALFAEQMMAIVSHDLRNPLTVIRMSAHLLSMGELSSNQQRALARLNSSNARAARLIADLLDFSQARSGAGLKISLRELDLHRVVDEAVEDLRTAYPERSLLHHQVGEGDCFASADRLVQMIGNLVSNAVTYGAVDRQIVITSTVDKASFCVAVHNEGQAIRPELLPTLFEPMTRGAEGDSSTHSIGLGLFIVREIAKAHGGIVVAHSSAEHGTTFTATIPRKTPSSETDGTR